jgi:hypothetical protein
VVYSDLDQRNRLIQDFIGESKVRWGSLTVMSARCTLDKKFFAGKKGRRGGGLGLPPPKVVDVGHLLESAEDPAKEILSILEKVRLGGTARSPSLIIGDWAHTVYDRFELMLAVERTEKGSANHVCCYRGEGFWSLTPEHIAEICELHDRVILRPAVSGGL